MLNEKSTLQGKPASNGIKELKELVQIEELKARITKAIYENFHYRYLALLTEMKLRDLETKGLSQEDGFYREEPQNKPTEVGDIMQETSNDKVHDGNIA